MTICIKPSRTAPALVKLVEREKLTQEGSSKKTYHVALDLRNSGIEFSPGDSIGVYGQNDPRLVQHLLDAMGAQGDEQVEDSRTKEQLAIREFLSKRANLSRLTSSFLKLFYDHESSPEKKERLAALLQKENKALLSEYLKAHDPLDLFKEYRGVKAPLQELCNQFGPLLPRFYSIASSLKVAKEKVDLTVALTTFTHSGEIRYGVASHFLCNLAELNKTPIPIYVQPAHTFRLPEDVHAPVIMIGPGTGVAPFRAFMQERAHLDHGKKNWLFFGERNQKTDYFYKEFWDHLVTQKRMRLDLAFSRDQSEKVYVQHRMLEQAKDLWAWIQEGAHIYVCGDAERMAKDVDAAMHLIVEKQGNFSAENAKAFLKELRAQKRYLFDIY